MRAVLDFSNGVGSDVVAMHTIAANERRGSSSALATSPADTAETCSTYVPGPFLVGGLAASAAPSAEPGTQPSLGFASGGFRPQLLADAPDNEEPVCREPQSVVVTAMVVGLLLAALGYFLDIR